MRFGNPGGLEAREPRDLEARRPGGGARPPKRKSWEPIERSLEAQEVWKLGNLEVWRLGGLEEALDRLRDHPGSLQIEIWKSRRPGS